MSKKAQRVYLWGWFGHKNSGDDALLTMMSKAISEVAQSIELVLQIPKYGQLPPLSCAAVSKPIRRWFKGHVQLSQILNILRTNALVFGGGSNMSDVDSDRMSALRLRYYICRIIKIEGIPMIVAALGLGPLVTKEGTELATKILNMMDLVVVRDSTSYQLCKHLSISSPLVQGFDPTVLIPKLYPIQLSCKSANDCNMPVIGISLSRSPGTCVNDERRQSLKVANLVNAIKHVVTSRPLSIAAIEMCADEHFRDMDLCRTLVTELRDVCKATVIPYHPSPIVMMRQLANLTAVIAERLHAGIYAYALGIPFAVVPYHSKCTAFVKDIGLSEKYLLDPEMPTEQIIQVLESLMDANTDCKPVLSPEHACEMASLGQRAVTDKLKALLQI
jgi:polysaccharide pyruvyl transferase WcaK-like protein